MLGDLKSHVGQTALELACGGAFRRLRCHVAGVTLKYPVELIPKNAGLE